MLNIILLSGGSGKRLWPLSNDSMSKQFLKLLPGPDGQPESMVQRVYRQIQETLPSAQVFVSTNAAQASSITTQLGAEVEVIIEPERRNTYPAILLSVAWLALKKKYSRHEAVVIVPIDVFAEPSYFRLLEDMAREVRSMDNGIVLMGARPSYPSEKYGYALPNIYRENALMEVSSFCEKPDRYTAESLINQGALWNCGVFAFTLGYGMRLLEKHGNFQRFEEVYKSYSSLSKNSFDYEVVEKEDSVGLLEYRGLWKDLGTWNTLTEEVSSYTIGRDVLLADSCHKTHVFNMLDLPVIVMGLKDSVVVTSHDGILVTDKEQSSFLKPLADQITQRPMYEQRVWGSYRVLEYTVDADGNATLTKRLCVNKGKNLSYQYHQHRTEVWTIIRGQAEFVLNGVRRTVSRGDVLQILPFQKHAVRAITDTEIIEVQTAQNVLEEEDITHLDYVWGE